MRYLPILPLLMIAVLSGILSAEPSSAHRLPEATARSAARAEAQRNAREFSANPERRPRAGIPGPCERVNPHVRDCVARYAFAATARTKRFICHQAIRVRYSSRTSLRLIVEASLTVTCSTPS